jgi:uncharacterized protein YcbK (DUF882 family)
MISSYRDADRRRALQRTTGGAKKSLRGPESF